MLDRLSTLRSRSTSAVLPISALLFVTLLGAQPATAPAQLGAWPFGFIDDFRIGDCLQTAVDIQVLEPPQRAKRMLELAGDSRHGSQVFPLCRMLFQAKPSGEFRRPRIGGPEFIDRGNIRDWPLEPITLREGVPILVVTGYHLAGVAESPEKYLEYCLTQCDWSETVYAVKSKEQIKQIVEEFIASDPKFADHAKWLREQVE